MGGRKRLLFCGRPQVFKRLNWSQRWKIVNQTVNIIRDLELKLYSLQHYLPHFSGFTCFSQGRALVFRGRVQSSRRKKMCFLCNDVLCVSFKSPQMCCADGQDLTSRMTTAEWSTSQSQGAKHKPPLLTSSSAPAGCSLTQYIFFIHILKTFFFIYLYIYIALHDNSLFLSTEAAVVQLVKWCSKCAVLWEHTQRKPAPGVIKGHSLCLTGA